MPAYGKIFVLALGAVAATAFVVASRGPTSPDIWCPPSEFSPTRFTTDGQGASPGSALCVDTRPVTHLFPVHGDVSLTPTADGRGVQLSLVYREFALADGVAPPSFPIIRSGSASARDEAAPYAPQPRRGFEVPSLVTPVRANRPDMPEFEDEPIRDLVATEPSQAWISQPPSGWTDDVISRPVTHSEPSLVEGAYIGATPEPAVDAEAGQPRNSPQMHASLSDIGVAQDGASSAGSRFSQSRASSSPASPTDASGIGSLNTSTQAASPDPSLAPETAPVRAPGGAAGPGRMPMSRFAGSPSAGGAITDSDMPVSASRVAAPPEEEPVAAADGPAPPADRTAVTETAVEEAPRLPTLGTVALRAGEHARYSRLVFDWPREVDYSVEESGATVRITFSVQADIDAERARRTSLSRVSGFGIEQTADGVVLTISRNRAGGVQTFRLENRIVIDISDT